jgi:hypothetical protein
VARDALGLREPRWTTDGEILNVDRLAHFTGPREGFSARWTTPESDTDLVRRLKDFLDEVVQPRGFVYKDVIQPFVVSDWLPRTSLRVLRVVRPVADVAYAMTIRGWDYPAAVASPDRLAEAALVEGLLRARGALATVPAVILDYDELVTDEQSLAAALATLYPEARAPAVRYRNEVFEQERRRQFARRGTPRYKALAALVEELEGRLAAPSSR